jgi:single-stranded DNA-binding protein
VASDLKIGDRAYVEGRIRVRRYERDGATQTSLNVAAFTFQPVGRIGRKRPNRSLMTTVRTLRARARVIANMRRR